MTGKCEHGQPEGYCCHCDSARASKMKLRPDEKLGDVLDPSWKDIKTAPMDGTRILLIRRSGISIPGRWAVLPGSIFRNGPQWLSNDYKYVDVPIDPVVGWKPLEED